MIKSFTLAFLSRIFDKNAIDQMPREIRYKLLIFYFVKTNLFFTSQSHCWLYSRSIKTICTKLHTPIHWRICDFKA